MKDAPPTGSSLGDWDKLYRERTHLSRWPWSDVVSLVMRHSRPAPGMKVLELGVGAGANIPFFVASGVEYSAIEGSSSIVDELRSSFPALSGQIQHGDFTEEIPFAGPFDLIVDRASVTHNTAPRIRSCLRLVREHLRSGGAFVGVDWFSTRHAGFGAGEPVPGDPLSRTGIRSGPFAGVGIVHFSNSQHLLDLFSEFDVAALEHKVVEQELPERTVYASWNIVARRR